jgi:hypothetical protein
LDVAWVLLDCELMPWSVKAQELIRDQYAAVCAAARAALADSTSAQLGSIVAVTLNPALPRRADAA